MANYAESGLKGAGVGAVAGSAAGPWGAVIGGGLGLAAGLFAAYEQEQDEAEKKEILNRIKREFNATQDEIEEMMAEYYSNPENFLGTKEDRDAYRNAVDEYNAEDFIYGYKDGKFDKNLYDWNKAYDKTVDDFVNPYYDKIIDTTSKKVQHSAAGAGVGRGTGAANAIAEAVAQKEDELYKTALQEYNTDRAQSYSEWAGNLDRMQQRLNQLKAAKDSKLALQGQLAQDYSNTQQSRITDTINAKQARSSGNASISSAELMI